MTANVGILAVGYAHDRVASTVVPVRDGPVITVVDPGRAPRPSMSGAPVGRPTAAQHGMSPS